MTENDYFQSDIHSNSVFVALSFSFISCFGVISIFEAGKKEEVCFAVTRGLITIHVNQRLNILALVFHSKLQSLLAGSSVGMFYLDNSFDKKNRGRISKSSRNHQVFHPRVLAWQDVKFDSISLIYFLVIMMMMMMMIYETKLTPKKAFLKHLRCDIDFVSLV